MFSVEQKRAIAAGIENLLLSIGHPEMPIKKPVFSLKVDGKEPWSWAEIRPNWMYGKDNPPSINPHNEAVANQMKTFNQGDPNVKEEMGSQS